MKEVKVGEVFGYYANIGVIALKLEGSLKVGDKIRIKGKTTDFEQEVTSMQIQHKDVQEAEKGADLGIKVKDRCRKGDKVYKISNS